MKAVVCAFYKEAAPLIKHYGLKKIDSKFEIFKNDEIVLIISGMGKINSAVATTYLLSSFAVDFAINFGIAGSSTKKIGDVFLVNKINSTLFPDILYSHPFEESEIFCSDTVRISGDFELVDMESEGFFKAAVKFLPLENIFIIKTISDNLKCFRPDENFMEKLIKPNLSKIVSFIDSLKKERQKIIDEKVLEEIAEKYRLSFSQKEILKNRLIYLKLNGKEIPKIDFEPVSKKKNFERIIKIVDSEIY